MKKVVQDLTSGGIDWQREKWQSGLGSKFIHQGEKNAVKYADEVIVLSKGVQDYFKEGFKAVHEYLVNGGKSCMAGFVLKNTLSDNGGVTRGICKMDPKYNSKEECCGCGACSSVCPKSAITMQEDALTHKDSVWATLPLEIIGAFRNMIRSFWWNREERPIAKKAFPAC